jgi:RNA polymerase sigma factor (sigma-70 family)
LEDYLVAHGERSSPNGQQLLAEFVQYGHQKPFEEIVRRYAGMVFNVCVRITKDKHEAEDATQAVFLTLALQAKRGTEIKALGPWLQQVAKRLSLDLRRSKKRRKTREERHQEEQTLRRESILGEALPEADLDELKTVLHEELQKLPAKYRLPLILHYFGGLTRDEMAAELNCKASTLGVRIFRGREMLAGRLSGRGINISSGALAIALGYTVQRAISHALISSTSYAATAMVAGHDPVGFASANVIGLTRRASSALVMSKAKIAALTLLIGATSLGASVKAMDMIPAIDVRQMISNQVERIVRPLFAPFSTPMHVDAQVKPAPIDTASAAPRLSYPAIEMPSISAPQTVQTVATVKAADGSGESAAPLAMVAPNAQMPSAMRMPWIDSSPGRSDSSPAISPAAEDHDAASTAGKSGDVADASTAGASAGGAGGGGSAPTDASGAHRSADSTAVHAETPSLPVPIAIATPEDLIVTPALAKSDKTSKSGDGTGSTTTTGAGTTAAVTDAATSSATPSNATAASQTATADAADAAASTPNQIVQIPAINGTVSESNGEVRGYGTVPRTGTIQMDGKVVADGNGIDRTLNLTSFTSIAKDITNAAAGGSNGWYAVNHGRLALPLVAGPSASTLTWGESPGDSQLDLVNSVRLTLQGDDAAAPRSLSLLSPDRTDVPSLTGIDGATIGIWRVDPSAGSIDSAEVSVRYDDLLVDELGAPESSVSLWALCDATDSWNPVTTFSLDTVDHTVSGDATDFSYFAVAVPPAPGVDAAYLTAHPQGQLGVVPEPVGIIWLTLGGAMLARRRRRIQRTG